MLTYIIKRLSYILIISLFASFFSFLVIELPPGNFVSYKIAELEAQGDEVGELQIQEYTERYGLDKPLFVRYLIWISNFMRGDFGESLSLEMQVSDAISQRLILTLMVALASIFITWTIAIILGVVSAVNQYSLRDQVITSASFIGLGVPPFLLALVILYIVGIKLEMDVGGLFSRQYIDAPWSFGKIMDLLGHLWVPAAIGAITGSASLIRIMRGNLLDILQQPFIEAARARGVKKRIVVWKHAVRIAIIPLLVILGTNILPRIIAGNALVAMVLNLPTIGPLYLKALKSQDMYLAGTILVFMVVFTMVGALLTDLALAAIDPRIRLTKSKAKQ